jgi:hypothetical protein
MRLKLAIVLATLTMTRSAAAEQFVLVDADYTHDKESHAYAKPLSGIPTNWRAPVNYAEGTAYYRLEVFEKPSAENLNMGVCFVGVSYCCFGYERFTKPGVYEWSFAIPSMWQYDKVDFTKPITEVPFIMRDRNAVKVDPGVEMFYGAPSTSLYFPMKSHLTITIVSKGATYMKPPVDAGVVDAAAADTAPVTMDSAVVEDTFVAERPDAATAVEDTATAAPAADPSTMEGSACAMGRSTNGAWFGCLIALAALRRVRRA